MKAYIEMEASFSRHITALSEVRHKVNAQQRNVDHEESELSNFFEERLAQLEARHDAAQYKSHPKFTSFRRKVWNVNHEGEALPDEPEDDLVISRTQSVSLHCPITRQDLVDPIKNRNCGHVYSQAAIQGVLATGGKIIARGSKIKAVNCPVAGCSAKVTTESLEKDREIEREIKRLKLKKTQQTQEDSDDEDVEDL
eukprot:TRINITY_DN6178_c0_g1_i2.p1 TRINITY_DN6178_c0_g1~~TRINITY_DN6178_c0_g1_i2.p1  ORF type:complete len:197 (-),score=36.36 TRINITY_DN6178_c0_g1_i2:129-719(-)